MPPRLIPYTIPQLNSTILTVLITDIINGTVKDGESIRRLEKSFSSYVGTRYSVSFASARSALFYIYKFFVNEGSKIALPSYTCIPAIDSARWAGCTPEFLDIDLDTYNPMFNNKLRKQDIECVSLSYLYGLIGNTSEIVDFAKEREIPVVEDAAIALGGEINDRKAGSIGDAGVFSLQESKIITSCRGGMVTTNNKKLFEYLNDIKLKQENVSQPKVIFNLSFSYARTLFSTPLLYRLTMYPLKKVMTTNAFKPVLRTIMGFNPTESIDGLSPAAMPNQDTHRLSNVQASVAMESMKSIEKIVDKRRETAKAFQEGLRGVETPVEGKGIRHAYGRFPIRLPGRSKIYLYKKMLSMGIETSINYPYICPKTKFMERYGFTAKDYPNALKASKETLLLPFHTYLSEQDISIIIDAVNKITGA